MPRFGTLLILLVAVLAIPAAAQASTLTIAQGVLTYRDTTAGDTNAVALALSPDGRRITVTENGRPNRSPPISIAGDGCCTAASTAGSCPAAAVTSLFVDTGPS